MREKKRGVSSWVRTYMNSKWRPGQLENSGSPGCHNLLSLSNLLLLLSWTTGSQEDTGTEGKATCQQNEKERGIRNMGMVLKGSYSHKRPSKDSIRGPLCWFISIEKVEWYSCFTPQMPTTAGTGPVCSQQLEFILGLLPCVQDSNTWVGITRWPPGCTSAGNQDEKAEPGLEPKPCSMTCECPKQRLLCPHSCLLRNTLNQEFHRAEQSRRGKTHRNHRWDLCFVRHLKCHFDSYLSPPRGRTLI